MIRVTIKLGSRARYPETVGVFEPTLELSCLDASIAMGAVIKRYGTVVLTSGTMSPLDIYPKLLRLKVVSTVATHLKVVNQKREEKRVSILAV